LVSTLVAGDIVGKWDLAAQYFSAFNVNIVFRINQNQCFTCMAAGESLDGEMLKQAPGSRHPLKRGWLLPMNKHTIRKHHPGMSKTISVATPLPRANPAQHFEDYDLIGICYV